MSRASRRFYSCCCINQFIRYVHDARANVSVRKAIKRTGGKFWFFFVFCLAQMVEICERRRYNLRVNLSNSWLSASRSLYKSAFRLHWVSIQYSKYAMVGQQFIGRASFHFIFFHQYIGLSLLMFFSRVDGLVHAFILPRREQPSPTQSNGRVIEGVCIKASWWLAFCEA